MDTRQLLSELRAERDRIAQAIDAIERLSGTSNRAGKAAAASAGKPRRKMSAAARKRISEAAKKRWAERRKAAAKA